MTIGGDPAANQAAYEAGELDMLRGRARRTCRAIKADPDLGPASSTTHARSLLRLRLLRGPSRASRTTQGPDGEQELPDRADPGDRQGQALIDATVYGGQGQRRRQLRCRASRACRVTSPISAEVRRRRPPRPSMATALDGARLRDVRRAPGLLKFGFNTGAGHEPRVAYLPGLADRLRAQDRADRQRRSTSSSRSAPRASTTSPATRWGADYPHPDNQLAVCSPAAAATTTSEYNNPDFDALIDQAGAEPDPAKAGRAVQPGPAAPRRRRAGRSSLAGASATTRSSRRSSGVTGTADGLGRHRRLVLRDHPDREALGSAPGRLIAGGAGPPATGPSAHVAQGPVATTGTGQIEAGRRDDVISYIVRRLLWIIPVLFAVSIITFILMHAVPGGPWDAREASPGGRRRPAQRQVRPGPAALRPVRPLGRQPSSRATSGRRTGSWTGRVNDIVARRPLDHRPARPHGLRRCPSSSGSRSGSSPPSATTAGPTTSPPASRSSASPRPASCWRSC